MAYDVEQSKNKKGQTDWERLRAMTDEEAYQNALTDPDNQPLSESDFHSLKVKRVSRKLGQR
ncbi:hypothetical protein C7H19_24985 [Aphanothece hegewaldii CCALA 016]|uniref:Uncharacterized protein n=1 Tax=Aphanothece hegewaldii CCALA 016 TaxID=2107694 RepID=A0A2T1LQE3_9CHRO|nr:hypothetical protein [Aphanothece hegewaldii]PSF27380.1 hypothetical protein C7H19_24985 [Aphanothece hegewaldii CCALA 016]